LLAAASIYVLAAALAVFVQSVTPPWICLLALLISAHAYLLDLFNFSFAIGLYLLPAALSVWGAVGLMPCLAGMAWPGPLAASALAAKRPSGWWRVC